MKQNKGITIVALVVTIIILLILAGIIINLSIGENGIIKKAEQASRTYKEQKAREKLELVLLDLQADKAIDTNYNEKEYIDKRINEEQMAIEEDTVIVDGWKFLIDRSVPKIVANLGKGEELALVVTTPYVGTRSFTIKVQYIANEEEVESYTYILDGKEMTTNENKEYTIEDYLEPETIHTIQVIAKYKDSLTLESKVLTIKTEPRTYLYNNGDQCVAITEGWQEEIMSQNEYYRNNNIQWFKGNGNYSSGTYTENSNTIYMVASHPGNSQYGATWVSMVSKGMIDLTKYRKIQIDAEFATNINAFWQVEGRNDKGEETIIDIASKLNIIDKQFLKISLCSSATKNTVGELVIKSIWLEK